MPGAHPAARRKVVEIKGRGQADFDMRLPARSLLD